MACGYAGSSFWSDRTLRGQRGGSRGRSHLSGEFNHEQEEPIEESWEECSRKRDRIKEWPRLSWSVSPSTSPGAGKAGRASLGICTPPQAARENRQPTTRPLACWKAASSFSGSLAGATQATGEQEVPRGMCFLQHSPCMAQLRQVCTSPVVLSSVFNRVLCF